MPDDPKRKAFFISPIGSENTEIRTRADQALRHIVRKALEPLHIDVERADEDEDPGLVTRRMISSILNADIVVIDLTGRNPNVFYEMAIAHGYAKPCVHMITAGESIPFDVQDVRTVVYTVTDPDKMQDAVTRLRKLAESALEEGTTTTPLSGAARFNVLESSQDPALEALAEMTTRFDQTERAIRQAVAALAWLVLRSRAELGTDPDLKPTDFSSWLDEGLRVRHDTLLAAPYERRLRQWLWNSIQKTEEPPAQRDKPPDD